MAEKEKTPSDTSKKDQSSSGGSQRPETSQSKMTAALKKENEALEEATKKQDKTISSLSKNIKELRSKKDK